MHSTRLVFKIKLIKLNNFTSLNKINNKSRELHTCLCGVKYYNNKNKNNSVLHNYGRAHSMQSDHHRQKVVLETATPKIIVDKLAELEKKIKEESVEKNKLIWKNRIDPYIKLARWDKPIGVYLLYWPCTWSIALASIPATVPLQATLQTAGLFLVGAGLMRGAGCTINDMWDKDIDRQVERTKDRPLASGEISSRQALGFLAGQLSLALGILLQLNCYSVVLGASSMLLVVTYPLAKRFTNYPQIFLGATFNWGALLGYSAIQGSLDPTICLPLYAAALSWTVIYDTIYAHQDKLDDARIGMKSTALTFGPHTKPALFASLAVFSGCLAGVGLTAELQWPYAVAVAAATVHAGRQIYTLNTEDATDCAVKFKSNSMVGLLILLGILGGGYKTYIGNRQRNTGKEDLEVTKSCLVKYV